MDRPDPPKRPMSGFFRFMKDVEPKMKKKYPELKRTQLLSKIGKEWKTKSEAQKTKYQKGYEKDKKVYNKLFEAYVQKFGKPKRKRRGKKSKN